MIGYELLARYHPAGSSRHDRMASAAPMEGRDFFFAMASPVVRCEAGELVFAPQGLHPSLSG